MYRHLSEWSSQADEEATANYQRSIMQHHWNLRKITYFNSSDLKAIRIPPLPLPTFDTHRAQAEQTDSSIAFAHLYAVQDPGFQGFVGVIGVNPVLPEHRKVDNAM